MLDLDAPDKTPHAFAINDKSNDLKGEVCRNKEEINLKDMAQTHCALKMLMTYSY